MKEWVSDQIKSGGKFKLYNIKKANAMLQTQGYLAAVGTESNGFWDIISKKKENVNTDLSLSHTDTTESNTGDAACHIHNYLIIIASANIDFRYTSIPFAA